MTTINRTIFDLSFYRDLLASGQPVRIMKGEFVIPVEEQGTYEYYSRGDVSCVVHRNYRRYLTSHGFLYLVTTCVAPSSYLIEIE